MDSTPCDGQSDEMGDMQGGILLGVGVYSSWIAIVMRRVSV